MYQAVSYPLYGYMSNPIANRNDNPYSSLMGTLPMETLKVDTSIFPVVWRHLDDLTVCERHQVCPRDTYCQGGRPDFGSPILAE